MGDASKCIMLMGGKGGGLLVFIMTGHLRLARKARRQSRGRDASAIALWPLGPPSQPGELL